MAETYYLAAFITVTAVATFATRVTPFLFLSRHSDHPLMKHLGKYLPASVMALLVAIFLSRAADWSAPAFGANALLPSVIVVLLHLWQRNALLSIIAGTASYMAIQQLPA